MNLSGRWKGKYTYGSSYPSTPDIPEIFTGKIPNTYIFYKPANNADNNGKITTLEYGINNNWRSPVNNFGPEEGIGHFVTAAGHRIAIVKYAYGGSKLVLTETPAVNGYWQTNAKDSLNHYSILITNWANQAIDAFRQEGFKPYISAFVWCQGEADAHDKKAASQYKDKLEELLDAFKKDMYNKDNMVNNMRVIITRTRKGFPYSDRIRKVQADIASSYHNAYLVDSDSWMLENDKIHFTALSQATLHGKAISDILLKVIP